jgi:hypothetical protein|tara:strand:- start:264 stop:590 length:327 start_codon:yes stop_codon:yes gene_type:complete
MSHFYGSVQGNRGQATRGGSKKSGYHATVASWDGALRIRLFHHNGKDCFAISQSMWHGKGVEYEITRGILGEESEMKSPGYDKGWDKGYMEALYGPIKDLDASTSESI